MKIKTPIGALSVLLFLFIYDAFGPYIGIPIWGWGIDYIALLCVGIISSVLLVEKGVRLFVKGLVALNLAVNGIGFLLVLVTFAEGLLNPVWGYFTDSIIIVATLAIVAVKLYAAKSWLTRTMSVLLVISAFTAWGPYVGSPNIWFGIDYLSIVAFIISLAFLVSHLPQLPKLNHLDSLYHNSAFLVMGFIAGFSILSWYNTLALSAVCIPTPLGQRIRYEHFNTGIICIVVGGALMDTQFAFFGYGLYSFGIGLFLDDTYKHYSNPGNNPFSYTTGCLIKMLTFAAKMVLP